MDSEEKTRLRQCCPSCQSLSISRKLGIYKCGNCENTFQKPALKEAKIYTKIPKNLQQIVEWKKRR